VHRGAPARREFAVTRGEGVRCALLPAGVGNHHAWVALTCSRTVRAAHGHAPLQRQVEKGCCQQEFTALRQCFYKEASRRLCVCVGGGGAQGWQTSQYSDLDRNARSPLLLPACAVA
jgi:hypothetical protein